MDASLTNVANGGAGSSSTSAATAPPNSTELMIALSQIQQLIPLLEYRPGGLTHLLPTLLTPLLPVQETVPGESMQRYRANVDHAFRVAAELVGRVQDGASVGSALELAERLMQGGDEKARLLRVRKKRRLFVEQEKVLEVNSWGPPVPPARSAASAKKPPQPADKSEEAKEQEKVEVCALLPSQNPSNTALAPSQQNLPPPTTAQAVQSYLDALHTYLKTTVDKGLFPPTLQLKQIKARIVAFTPQGFTLELQIARLIKALIDASITYAASASDSAEPQGELQSVDLTALTVGGVDEAITSTTRSGYPIFRSLSSDVLAQTHRATSANRATSVWTTYMPITETIARLALAAATFQA